MRRVVGQQSVHAVGRYGDGVHGQLLPEGFLFAPVGEPVVDSHFSDQIRAEALSFGGGDASLKTFGSAEQQVNGEKGSGWLLLGDIFQKEAVGRCCVLSTCCTLLPKLPSPPCWGSSGVHRPGTGFAGMPAPI